MIDPQRVDEIFRDCLFEKAPEDLSLAVIVEGITMKVGFDPTRMAKHHREVLDMLMELPESFLLSKGMGHSFLAACEDKHGNQWTGLHTRMEQLFVLGEAMGYARCCLPRQYWHLFHAGMPYYVVLDEPMTDEKDLLKILEKQVAQGQSADPESLFKFDIFGDQSKN